MTQNLPSKIRAMAQTHNLQYMFITLNKTLFTNHPFSIKKHRLLL